MAKQYVTQEAYDKMKDLVSAKNEYEYLTSVGATDEAKKYSENAKPMYNFLLDYDKNIANNFSGMNSVQAKEYFDNFAVARDEKSILGDISLGKYGWANSKTDDDKNKFQTNTVQYYEELASVNPQLADIVKGWDYNQLNSYITTGKMPDIKTPDSAVAANGGMAPVAKTPVDSPEPQTPPKKDTNQLLGSINNYQYVIETSKDPSRIEEAKAGLEGLYMELAELDPSLAARVKNMGYNDTYAYIKNGASAIEQPTEPTVTGKDLAVDTHGQLSTAGATIQDNINKMYFDPNYGKDVMNMFNLYGNTEGMQALANGAAANGGNFDSFAEYNKNNTNLAYQIAGQNAVQKMREGYADSSTKLFDTWGNQINTSAANLMDYDYNDKALESGERVAMEELASNERIETMKDATNRYEIDAEGKIALSQHNVDIAVAQIEADAQKYGWDTEEKIARIQQLSEKYGWDADTAIALAGYASDEKIAQVNADAAKHVAETEAASAEKIAAMQQATPSGTGSADGSRGSFAGGVQIPLGAGSASGDTSGGKVPKGDTAETPPAVGGGRNGDDGADGVEPAGGSVTLAQIGDVGEGVTEYTAEEWRKKNGANAVDKMAQDISARGGNYGDSDFLDFVIQTAADLRKNGAPMEIIQEFLGKFNITIN